MSELTVMYVFMRNLWINSIFKIEGDNLGFNLEMRAGLSFNIYKYCARAMEGTRTGGRQHWKEKYIQIELTTHTLLLP